MLFSGPTGVGKTELCRILAKELYGRKEAFIRLDMTEYMEKQSDRNHGFSDRLMDHETRLVRLESERDRNS